MKKKKTMRISSQISFPAGGGDGLCGKATRPIFASFSYQRCPRVLSIENFTLDPATVVSPSCCMFMQMFLHGGVLTVVRFLSFATMKRISTPKYHSRYLGLKSITRLTYQDHDAWYVHFYHFKTSYLTNLIEITCVSYPYMMRLSRALILSISY